MRIQKPEDLAKERDRVLAERQKIKTRILVGVSSCGIAAGAKEVLARFQELLTQRGITDVVAEQTGCVGYCYTEPTVEIVKDGGRKLLLGPVREEDVQNVFDMHVVNDLPNSKYVLPCSFKSCLDGEGN